MGSNRIVISDVDDDLDAMFSGISRELVEESGWSVFSFVLAFFHILVIVISLTQCLNAVKVRKREKGIKLWQRRERTWIAERVGPIDL